MFNTYNDFFNDYFHLISFAKVSKKNDMTKQLTYFNIKW